MFHYNYLISMMELFSSIECLICQIPTQRRDANRARSLHILIAVGNIVLSIVFYLKVYHSWKILLVPNTQILKSLTITL